jgi:hypothetical protein
MLALFPNADGLDEVREQVTIHNGKVERLPLDGWRFQDRATN